ncbi:MAG: hypothetical protein ACREL3_03090 [Gemmatimonadales bacterium]
MLSNSRLPAGHSARRASGYRAFTAAALEVIWALIRCNTDVVSGA